MGEVQQQRAGTSVHLPETSRFDDWIPRDYLAEYFSELQEDERPVIRYFVEQVRGAQAGPVLLFVCGPGLSHVFLTAALRRSQRYRVGPRHFPSADIDESELRHLLARDFHPAAVQVEALDVPEQEAHGYSGILLARARKARG